VLHSTAACIVYALAEAAQAQLFECASDAARLINLELIERDSNRKAFVPFDAVGIRLTLAQRGTAPAAPATPATPRHSGPLHSRLRTTSLHAPQPSRSPHGPAATLHRPR
jgi:hypothetical protein